ncbi:MAG: recombination-associated protein RdgC [Gammaproteobacteria bacterium]|nr:recombination-associated protein RdgC [Gammaproteobacteria bacterium]
MWFRALRLYSLTAPLPFGLDDLEAALGNQPFRSCGTLELSSAGFEPVLGPKAQSFVHVAEGVWTVRWVSEEKRLPGGFVREQLAEKVMEYEAREGHAPGSREKKEMREEIEHALLPHLIPRRRRLFASIDAERGWVMVDSAASKQAEALLGALRQATGTLPVSPWRTQEDWSAAMTRWLASRELPEGFELDQTCVLTAEDHEGGIAILRKHDLTAEEVKAHLASGKKVTRLGLVWRDRMSFVLDATGVLRSIKPTDVLLEPLEQMNDDDAIVRIDQTLALQDITLRALLDELNHALGGRI